MSITLSDRATGLLPLNGLKIKVQKLNNIHDF